MADWLPGPVQGEGIDGSAITVHQLLQHTSGFMTRDGITEHGTRGVVLSVNTTTPVPEGDATRALIENALCS